MPPYMEVVTFRARPGITPDQVRDAALDVNLFLREQPGFVSRHLGQADDETWYDVLCWESEAHLGAAMARVESSTHCSLFFSMIDPGHDRMALFPAVIALAAG